MGAGFGNSGSREIPLELGERSKDAQHELIEGSLAQSLGRHDFECDVVVPKLLEQRDEMPQISREPVEAIDNELLDAARPDDAQQSVQGRPVEGRTRVAFVVKTLFDDHVAQGALGLNVGLAQIELDLAGGEISMWFYRLAGVDGAANRRSGGRRSQSVAQNTPRIGDL